MVVDLRNVADLHLEAAIILVARLRDNGGERIKRLVTPIVTRGGIASDRLAIAAQQAPKRQAGGLAQDVPAGDVDAGEAGDHHALATVHVGRVIDLVTNQLGPARVLTDDERRDLAFDDGDRRRMRAAPHGGLAPADNVGIVGHHLDQNRLAVLVLTLGVGNRIGHAPGETEGFNASDLHRRPRNIVKPSSAVGYASMGTNPDIRSSWQSTQVMSPQRTTGDAQGLACYTARVFAAQEGHKGANFLGLQKTALRHPLLDHHLAVLVNGLVVDPGKFHLLTTGDVVLVRRHPTRTDRVAGDAVGRTLQRHTACQAKQAGLGRAVGRMVERADQSGGRGEVDDPAPSALDHARQTELRGAVGPCQVHIQHGVPERVGMIDDGVPAGMAGGVDQDIDRAKLPVNCLETIAHRDVVGHVERHGQGANPVAFQIRGRFGELISGWRQGCLTVRGQVAAKILCQ